VSRRSYGSGTARLTAAGIACAAGQESLSERAAVLPASYHCCREFVPISEQGANCARAGLLVGEVSGCLREQVEALVRRERRVAEPFIKLLVGRYVTWIGEYQI
jgi:hypothetical protein